MSDYPIISSVKVGDGTTVKIEYHKMLYSTSELAKKYAREGYPDRYVVFTEAQGSSKITGTKLADGEFERGIFLSCILRPSFFPSQAGLLGHLAAVGVISALDEYSVKPLGLGWVSDIYCGGARIGGCTLEGKLDSYATYEYLIINVAVRLDNESFPPRLTDMIRKVFGEGYQSVPMIIARSVLGKMLSAYASIRNPGKYMDEYRRRFILFDEKIKYIDNDKRKSCRIVDINKDEGSIFVETKSGKRLEIKSPSLVIMPKKLDS